MAREKVKPAAVSAQNIAQQLNPSAKNLLRQEWLHLIAYSLLGPKGYATVVDEEGMATREMRAQEAENLVLGNENANTCHGFLEKIAKKFVYLFPEGIWIKAKVKLAVVGAAVATHVAERFEYTISSKDGNFILGGEVNPQELVAPYPSFYKYLDLITTFLVGSNFK